MKDKRRLVPVKGFAGIYRIQVRDPLRKSGWSEPARGAKFQACRIIRGKLKKKNCHTFEEAKRFRLQPLPIAESSDAAGFAGELFPSEKPKTLRELIARWEKEWLPTKDISTQIRYRSYLKHFEFLSDVVVDKLEPSYIDAWIIHLKKPEYLARGHTTRCSYDHEFSVLRVILNYYASRFNRNFVLPFIKDHKAMLKVKEKARKKKDLTVDQFRSFMEALWAITSGTKWEVIYYLAGMQYAIYGRIQDAAALHVEDFDFKMGKLHVRRKAQWLRARGFQDQVVDGSKKDGGKELDMPELAAQLFREWVMKSGIRSGLLFQIDGGLITYRQIEDTYNQALKKAGLPFTATHLFRHASLTEAYNTCKDLLVVQRLAGHRDLKSTAKYAKVRDEEVKKAQTALDAKLRGILTEK